MTSYHYKQYLLYARVAMIGLAILLICFLLAKDLVLSGQISYRSDFNSRSPFFSELVPKQRVELGESGATILEDPIYTTLSYPRPFQEVVVTTEFSNPDGAFIEHGYQNGPGEAFDLQALHHPQLNLVFDNQDSWSGVAKNEESVLNGASSDLYQKRSAPYIYGGVDQFWDSLPEQQRTGYYGVEVERPYVPEPKGGSYSLQYPLRGAHNFFLSTTKDLLDINFEFADLNLVPGEDSITVELYDWDGNLLATESYTDTEPLHSLAQEEITMRLRSDSVSNNEVVKMIVQASNDIVLTSMEANTSYVVMQGRVYIAGGTTVADRISLDTLDTESLYTSARTWVATTSHRDSVQNIYIGPETLKVEKPLENYTYRKPPSENFLLNKGYAFVIERGDIVLQGRGVFALDQSSYFSPYPWYIDSTIELENSEIAYIITDYLPPVKVTNELYRQSIYIDLDKAFAPNKKLRTQISLPRIKDHLPITLHSIEADYSSEPVTFSNAGEKAMRFIERELSN